MRLIFQNFFAWNGCLFVFVPHCHQNTDVQRQISDDIFESNTGYGVLIFKSCRNKRSFQSWRIFGHLSALDQSCASENIWWIRRSDICPWASVCWRQCTRKTKKHPIQAKKFWKMELHREPRSPPARSRQIKVSSKKTTLLSWGDWKFQPGDDTDHP